MCFWWEGLRKSAQQVALEAMSSPRLLKGGATTGGHTSPSGGTSDPLIPPASQPTQAAVSTHTQHPYPR